MPLLDSFTVDHTRMEAPAVRVAKTMNTPHGDAITVFDLRFCVPNKEVMPERGIHTLEHLFAGFMRNHLNGNGARVKIVYLEVPWAQWKQQNARREYAVPEAVMMRMASRLEILREEDFVAEREASERRQQEMEAADTEPFAVWLEKHA